MENGGWEGGKRGRGERRCVGYVKDLIGCVGVGAASRSNPLTPPYPPSLHSVIQKLYLRWMDTGASGEDLLRILEDTKKVEGPVEVVEAAARTEEEGKKEGGEVGHVNGGAGNGGGDSSSALTEEQEQKKAEEKEKKRKSRWGGGEEEAGTLTAGAATAAATGTESKRRSRWGDGGGATGEAGSKKKSR